MASLKFTKKMGRALELLIDGRPTDEQIAASVKVTRRTLANWKLRPDFKIRMEEAGELLLERYTNKGLARREMRLLELGDRHRRLKEIIEERSADPELAEVPGGKTGLITKTLKGIGKGDDFQVVEVFETAKDILTEMRLIEEQIAVELGQRVQKHEVDVRDTANAVEEIKELLNMGKRKTEQSTRVN